MPLSRKVVNAACLSGFAAAVGFGLALCRDERWWIAGLGVALASTGSAGLLLYALAGPGGW